MRSFILAIAALSASPAMAQTVFDRAEGVYGSVLTRALSCTENPHRLSFEPNLRHANFNWSKPAPGPDKRLSDHARYDVLDYDDTSITLYLEGETQLTDAGERVVWIFRLTESPAGYCWGRKDWPSVRCVAPAQRCDVEPPSS